MRLSDEEVRARFERECIAWHETGDSAGVEVVDQYDAIDFALRLARDLQAPPTGEEVERAAKVSDEAIRLVRNAGYDEGVEANCEMPEPGARERTKDNSDAEEASAIAAVRAYGAACHAAGRAEACKCEPTDATESEAFCALRNRLTDLLNSRGHYQAMTAYQSALERYREAVASEARGGGRR